MSGLREILAERGDMLFFYIGNVIEHTRARTSKHEARAHTYKYINSCKKTWRKQRAPLRLCGCIVDLQYPGNEEYDHMHTHIAKCPITHMLT